MFVKQTLVLLVAVVSANLFVLPTAALWAQREGDRVVVTANYETKIYKKVVGEVYEGDIRTLKELNGRWCRLDDVEGWLPTQNVMSLDSALRHFSTRIEDNEKDEVALTHRGMIFHELEEFNRALNDLNNALVLNQKNSVIWMSRGIVRKALNQNQLAAKDFKKAIKIYPDSANAHFNLGLVYYASDDFKQALEHYNLSLIHI